MGEGAAAVLPGLAAVLISHRAAKLIELPDHHQGRYAGRERLVASRDAASILRETRELSTHL